MEENDINLTQLLELNENNIHHFIDAMPVGAMVTNHAGKILYANLELEHELGYENGDLHNKNINELLSNRFKDDHDSLIDAFIKNPKKRKMGADTQLLALCADKTEMPIEIGLNPICLHNELGILVSVVNISARLQAINIFKRSIDSVPLGILVVTQAGDIHMVNQTLCDIFGYAKHELIGQAVEMLLPARYRAYHQKTRAEYTENPSMRMMAVNRDPTGLHRNGREFPVEIGLSPFEEKIKDKMVLISLVDITKRKRKEMELKETNKNLEEFTYVASHDLRSPLRGISDLLEWIEEDLGEDILPAVANNINRVSIRIKRMETLIENLLAYARAGKETTEIQTIDVDDLLNDVFNLVELPKHFDIKKEITLHTLESVKTPLETILRNLISNAIKHHDREKGHLYVSCHAENNMCHFSIVDDGPGIPEASLDRIFRLFQSATSSAKNSSGIGLSVSRRLAETHGGRIRVENNTHQRGSTFHVWWPRFIRADNHD